MSLCFSFAVCVHLCVRMFFFVCVCVCVCVFCSSVTRVVRVISQPRGNMLLVGIGGSGRQSLARLAAYTCEYLLFQVEVTKQYRKQEFREGTSPTSHTSYKYHSNSISKPTKQFSLGNTHTNKTSPVRSLYFNFLQISLIILEHSCLF